MTTSRMMVTAAALRGQLGSVNPPRVVDVRTPGEFRAVHIGGAYNVPLDLLREHRDEIRGHLDEHVVLVCRSGQRAVQAEQALRSAGLVNLHILDGGMNAWEAAGFDVNRGTPRWELERQVRFLAGIIVRSASWPERSFRGGAVGGFCDGGGRTGRRGRDQYLRHGHDAGQAAVQPGGTEV